MITVGGAPVGGNQNSHINRERIPERVIHAKGSGAHGTFEGALDPTLLKDRRKIWTRRYGWLLP
jgi:hypothetical protein